MQKLKLGLCSKDAVCFYGCVNTTAFRQSMRAWFRRQGRDLPWRRTHDPYAILVSEVMLQQTTVVTVIPYFERWMKKFPTVQVLAASEESEVLALWQGLGYYRRARNLRAAARMIVERGGDFPTTYEELRALPGVGDYTAQAVRAFAYDIPTPVLDANILRVVARLFDIRQPVDTALGLTKVREKLLELLPAKGGRDFISALMELGALVCRAGSPDCLLCPVRRFCAAKHPEKLPVKAPKAAIKARVEFAAWVSDGKTLLLQQSQGKRWVGLWRLPPCEKRPDAAAEGKIIYSIVRERVTLEIFRQDAAALSSTNEPREKFSFSQLASLAIPSPHRRLIAKMGAQGRRDNIG